MQASPDQGLWMEALSIEAACIKALLMQSSQSQASLHGIIGRSFAVQSVVFRGFTETVFRDRGSLGGGFDDQDSAGIGFADMSFVDAGP